ncbi:MAG: trimethylamine methyltransferase family protein [Oscillospiraceae bacterium]|nr:trimethylamine methyltransferase family protein [Oscillospiraceae bacterium]
MIRMLDPQVIESIMSAAADIMDNVGVKFDHPRALETFRKHGARIEGTTVKIPNSMLEKALETMPDSEFEVETRHVGAGAMFGNVPVIYDDEKDVFRRVTLADTIKVYKLVETSDIYESSNPSTVDPEDLHAEDLYTAQLALYLKYSDKYLANGMRAISKNAKNGNIYESACEGFRLVKEFYGEYSEPVVDQTVCPSPPLGYDFETLENLFATIDEGQNLGICPCSLTCLTGPAGLFEMVVHDAAMALAGVVLAQLEKPGISVGLSNSSGATDMRTMQPTYGSVEATLIQCMFFEFCVYYKIGGGLCGNLCDAAFPNYQAGVETFLSTFLPYYYIDLDSIWCYPGDLSSWRCGSFRKAMYDEELIRNINRVFKPLDTTLPANFNAMLTEACKNGTFMLSRTPKSYRRDHYLSKGFSKYGIPGDAEARAKGDIVRMADEEIERRLKLYEMPERTPEQKKLLNRYLPDELKYT